MKLRTGCGLVAACYLQAAAQQQSCIYQSKVNFIPYEAWLMKHPLRTCIDYHAWNRKFPATKPLRWCACFRWSNPKAETPSDRINKLPPDIPSSIVPLATFSRTCSSHLSRSTISFQLSRHSSLSPQFMIAAYRVYACIHVCHELLLYTGIITMEKLASLNDRHDTWRTGLPDGSAQQRSCNCHHYGKILQPQRRVRRRLKHGEKAHYSPHRS